jgi:hypothetical protein
MFKAADAAAISWTYEQLITQHLTRQQQTAMEVERNIHRCTTDM